MSQSQSQDSSKRDDPLDELAVRQLRDFLDLYYPGDPKPVGIFTPLEDWSNPKLGVTVLVVRRPEIPYVDPQ